MGHPLVLILPFVLAATRSLALGVQPRSGSATHRGLSAEIEFEFLTVIAFSLVGLWLTISFMIRFPDIGLVIQQYNQF
jgi:hypothetical protein